MRIRKLLHIAVLAAGLSAAGSSFADDDSRLYRSAYYLGRGDTGIAIADDQEAIMYNPAGIAQGKGIYKRTILASPMVEFSDDARSLVQELGEEDADVSSILRKRVGKNEHLGIYNLSALVMRRAAVGVLASATTDILVYKSPDSGGLEAVDAKVRQTMGPTFTLADSFWGDHLYIGGTYKYLQRGQAQLNATVTDADELKDLDQSELYGIGVGSSTDVGMIYKGDGLLSPALGMTVHNLGGTTFTPTSAEAPTPDPLKQTVNVGLALQPGTKFSHLRILAEYWDVTSAYTTSTYKKLHFGGELSVRDSVGVTFGLAEGWTSGGFYVDLYLLRLDTGVYIQEVSERAGVRPDKRLFVRLTVGF